MKAPSPAFSLYPKDLLSDANCASMSDEEFGCYMRLLLHCWLEGFIPSDPARLARLTRRTRQSFDRIWPAIAPCFSPDGDNLVQKRLEEEREKQSRRAEENTAKGKKGGRPPKSSVSNKTEKPRLSSGLLTEKPGESLPSPSPFPSAFNRGSEAVCFADEPPMPNPTPVPAWEAKAKAIWSRYLGGENDYVYADLIPVVRRFGEDKTLKAWEAYCKAQAQNQGGKFASARSFAQKPGPWLSAAEPEYRHKTVAEITAQALAELREVS